MCRIVRPSSLQREMVYDTDCGCAEALSEQMRQRSLGRTNSAKWGKEYTEMYPSVLSHAASGLPPLLPSPGDVLE